MVRADKKYNRFGLVGKNIDYSFSRSYFTNKFVELGLNNHVYENFDLQQIEDFPSVLRTYNDLCGLNVTIPYKEVVIPYLDEIDAEASEIGAVNTIRFTSRGLIGYNTDVFGFKEAISTKLHSLDNKALILGTGGASKAVAHVLGQLGLEYKIVSRTPAADQLNYSDLGAELIAVHTVIVNCTPLGTFPDTNQKPPLPYHLFDQRHFLFDLIYNPEETLFLKEGSLKGARVLNGLPMLEFQAEKAWEIWNMPMV